MRAHLRKTVGAILVGAVTLGSIAAYAGDGGQHSAQRAKLKAEWAEARARDAANPDASLVERIFPGRPRETRLAEGKEATQPKKN